MPTIRRKRSQSAAGKAVPTFVAAVFIYILIATSFFQQFGQAQRVAHHNHFNPDILFSFSPQSSFRDMAANLQQWLVESITGINLNQMVSLIGDGLGFGGLVRPWQPVEAAEPTGFRFVRRQNLIHDPELLESGTDPAPTQFSGDGPLVYLFNTHTWERFNDNVTTVTDITWAMHDVLVERGIPVLMEERSVEAFLNERWGPLQARFAYDASRIFVEERILQHESLQFFFDIHRNSPISVPTSTINGNLYATITPVIGTNHVNYRDNLEVAREIVEMLEERRPGITGPHSILMSGGPLSNGIFNQDVSANMQLFEIGDNLTPPEAAYNSARLLAEVLADWMLEQGGE